MESEVNLLSRARAVPIDAKVIRGDCCWPVGEIISELMTEVERLKKIAAHVPARIYIKAKEDAGYGAVIKLMEQP